MIFAAPHRAAAAWRAIPASIAVAVLLTVALVVGVPGAVARASPPTSAESDADAVAALRRASTAAQHTTYSGVQYASSWSEAGTVSVVLEIRHTPAAGSVVEVRRTPFTRGMRYLGGAARASTPEPQSRNAHAFTDEVLDLLQHNYELQLDRTAGPAATVAGRACNLVTVRHSDGAPAARLWLDRSSGLLLRREVSDRNGVLLSAMTFVTIVLEPAPRALPGPGQEWTDGWSGYEAGPRPSDETPMAERSINAPWAEVSPNQAEQMRRWGWRLPAQLPGNLMLYDARRSERGKPVLHLAFSDGLSTVSLFQQRGRLDESDMVGWRQESIDGAQIFVMDTIPRRVAWSSDGTVYTMLADAPMGTVRNAVRSLPHRRDSEPGVRTRVGRGLARIGSWLNPFD